MSEPSSPHRSAAECGVVIVDHGSRRQESNMLLLDVAAAYRRTSAWLTVEPAHMELAEPSIITAFGRCVAQGARRVVVFPYFLSPGRHWHLDIPRLAAEAAAAHGDVPHVVTAPLGLHPLLLEVIDDRIRHCLDHLAGQRPPCDLCDEQSGCAATSKMRS